MFLTPKEPRLQYSCYKSTPFVLGADPTLIRTTLKLMDCRLQPEMNDAQSKSWPVSFCFLLPAVLMCWVSVRLSGAKREFKHIGECHRVVSKRGELTQGCLPPMSTKGANGMIIMKGPIHNDATPLRQPNVTSTDVDVPISTHASSLVPLVQC